MRAWQNYVLENTCPGINLIDVFKNISTNNGKYYPAIFEDKNIAQVPTFKSVLSGILNIVSQDFIFRFTIIRSRYHNMEGHINVELEHIVCDDILLAPRQPDWVASQGCRKSQLRSKAVGLG